MTFCFNASICIQKKVADVGKWCAHVEKLSVSAAGFIKNNLHRRWRETVFFSLRLSVGDWLLLVQLGQHFEPFFFTQVLMHVDSAMSGRSYENTGNMFCCLSTFPYIMLSLKNSVMYSVIALIFMHGLINYIDTKAKCRHLKKFTRKWAFGRYLWVL